MAHSSQIDAIEIIIENVVNHICETGSSNASLNHFITGGSSAGKITDHLQQFPQNLKVYHKTNYSGNGTPKSFILHHCSKDFPL